MWFIGEKRCFWRRAVDTHVGHARGKAVTRSFSWPDFTASVACGTRANLAVNTYACVYAEEEICVYFSIDLNRIQFGSQSEGKLSLRSYFFGLERNQKAISLNV